MKERVINLRTLIWSLFSFIAGVATICGVALDLSGGTLEGIRNQIDAWNSSSSTRKIEAEKEALIAEQSLIEARRLKIEEEQKLLEARQAHDSAMAEAELRRIESEKRAQEASIRAKAEAEKMAIEAKARAEAEAEIAMLKEEERSRKKENQRKLFKFLLDTGIREIERR